LQLKIMVALYIVQPFSFSSVLLYRKGIDIGMLARAVEEAYRQQIM